MGQNSNQLLFENNRKTYYTYGEKVTSYTVYLLLGKLTTILYSLASGKRFGNYLQRYYLGKKGGH